MACDCWFAHLDKIARAFSISHGGFAAMKITFHATAACSAVTGSGSDITDKPQQDVTLFAASLPVGFRVNVI